MLVFALVGVALFLGAAFLSHDGFFGFLGKGTHQQEAPAQKFNAPGPAPVPAPEAAAPCKPQAPALAYPYTIEVSQVFTDYLNNQVTANRKYLDKRLRIRGFVNRVTQVGTEAAIEFLCTEITNLATFRYREDRAIAYIANPNDLPDLRNGNRVEIEGTLIASEGQLVFSRCTFHRIAK